MESVKDKKTLKKEKKLQKKEARKNKKGLLNYIRGTKQELKKVSWPSKKELLSNTFVVLSVVIIFTLLTWVIDIGLQYLLNLIINMK